MLEFIHSHSLLGADLEPAPAHAWARRILDDTDIAPSGEHLRLSGIIIKFPVQA